MPDNSTLYGVRVLGGILAFFSALAVSAGENPQSTFTLLEPVAAPKITAASEAYPGGQHNPRNLIDGNARTEFSSNAKGTNTFLELDSGEVTPFAVFKHVDRNDPATVTSSELRFLDSTGNTVAAFEVKHANQRGGTTLFKLPSVVTARRVRWQIKGLGSPYSTVGGAEIAFFKAGTPETRENPSG